jgi:hypothetical protein
LGWKAEKLPRQSNRRGWKIYMFAVPKPGMNAITVTRPTVPMKAIQSEEREALLTKLETANNRHIDSSSNGIGGAAA